MRRLCVFKARACLPTFWKSRICFLIIFVRQFWTCFSAHGLENMVWEPIGGRVSSIWGDPSLCIPRIFCALFFAGRLDPDSVKFRHAPAGLRNKFSKKYWFGKVGRRAGQIWYDALCVSKAFVCRRKLPPPRNACLKLGEACDDREAGPRSRKKYAKMDRKSRLVQQKTSHMLVISLLQVWAKQVGP